MADTQNTAATRLGKTALLLHGLGVAFLLAGIAALAYLGAEHNESYTFLAFGGAGFLVLSLWSLLLAVHSYFRTERSAAAFAVVLVVLGEFTLIPLFHASVKSAFTPLGGQFWLNDLLDWLVGNCAPAASGLLFLIIGAGIPLARYLSRTADGARRDALSRRYFWRIAGVSALALGVPVFAVYSLVSLDWSDEPALNVTIARHIPVCLCDRLEAAVNATAGASPLQNALLYQGCVSADRLVTRLGDGNSAHFNGAEHGLMVSYPDRLLPACLQISKQDHAYACAYFSAANVICNQARPAQLRAIIAGREYKAQVRSYVIARAAERCPEVDFTSDILKFAAEVSDAPNFRRSVSNFDLQDPTVKDRFQHSWASLFHQKDWSSRAGLAYVIPYLEIPLPEQLPFFQQCLNDPDLRMQRGALSAACRGRAEFHWDASAPEDIKPWLNALLPLIDHKDIFIRRSAVQLIATLTGMTVSVTPDESALTEHADWTPAPPVSGEEQEREAARTAAKKWLAEHQ